MSHNALLLGSVESIQAFPVHVRRLMMLGVIGIEARGKVPGAPARKTLILGRWAHWCHSYGIGLQSRMSIFEHMKDCAMVRALVCPYC